VGVDLFGAKPQKLMAELAQGAEMLISHGLWRYLCKVRAGQYWRLENLNSFDDFLERRFPESRRKACQCRC
jgi:hypothetical protein